MTVAHAYPMMLDVSNRRIVIVGGGGVAARKAAGLIEAGATQLRVIAIEFKEVFPEVIKKVHRGYESADLKDANLVFAATDSTTINDRIVRDANAIGALVCRADGSDSAGGDFITPAKFEAGTVIVTVSAGSAALSAMVRDGLADRFDPAWSEMADAMKQLRPLIKSTVNDAARRSALLRSLATPGAVQVLKERGIAALKDWAFQK